LHIPSLSKFVTTLVILGKFKSIKVFPYRIAIKLADCESRSTKIISLLTRKTRRNNKKTRGTNENNMKTRATKTRRKQDQNEINNNQPR